MEGVSILLGNDLGDEKIMAISQLSSLPCISDNVNETSQEIIGLFPGCAVTLVLVKQVEKLLSDYSAKSHAVDLSYMFVAHSDLMITASINKRENLDAEMKKSFYTTKQLNQSDSELIPLLQEILL